MNYMEECCWWIQAKLTSEEQVQQKRALHKFEQGAKPELLKGTVFEWKRPTSAPGATALLSSALSSLSKLSGGKDIVPASIVGPSSVQVLVRLHLPNSKSDDKAPQPAIMTKITELVYQDDHSTSIIWSSLELEKNQPKYSGRVALHAVQTVKERDGWLVMSDHQNNSLFEGKCEDVKVWVEMIKEAMKVLAPQIEDEAAASRGVTYRSKQLERLEVRKQEREEMKKKLGPVTMAYTARAMMKGGEGDA